LVLRVRRFFCDDLTCRQRIFGERFDGAIQPRARRTARLDEIVYCLAIALGGRPAASLARRIGVAVSNVTLLRVVRRHSVVDFPPPSVVGIDDWAWRRNHRYGSLICDLERRKTIALLPDREPSTAEAWMRNQPQIVVVARDRGGSYAVATQRALPEAIQVADRWHLMENASQAFLNAFRKSMRPIRAAIGATTITPALLTFAEKLRYEGYLRREETNTAILELSRQRVAIKEIVRRTGYSRGLIRRYRADSGRTFSGPDAALLNPIFLGSMSNGPRAAGWRRIVARTSTTRISRLPRSSERMDRAPTKG
jgi:hypothetical protein